MSDKTRAENISRRDLVKKLSAVGVGLSTSLTATVTAKPDKVIPYDDYEQPYPEKTTTQFGPSLKAVTNHPEILAVSRESILRHFKSSDLSGREYEQALQYVFNLRKDYPIERVSHGGDTVIQLAPEAKTEPIYPAKDDIEEQHRHRNAIQTFAGKPHGEDGDEVSIQWSPSHHRDITEVLLASSSANLNELPIIYGSDDPDFFGVAARGEIDGICDQLDLGLLDGYKDSACDIVANALDVHHTNYAQYYDPEIASISFGPYGVIKLSFGLGKAPEATNNFYYDAVLENDEKKFGWSLHYLQDLAQPLHAGMGIKQAGFEMTWSGPKLNPKEWVHFGFEDLLRDTWDSTPSFSPESEPLKQIMRDSGTAGYIYPKTAAKNMAKTSNPYADDIYYEIFENESQREYDTWSWMTKYNVYKDIANCYSELGYLGRGMIEKFD